MRLIPVRPPFRIVEPVLVEERASVFYGMTHSKAVLIDEALHGYRVRVQSTHDIQVGIDPEVLIFERMILPGQYADLMQGPYDLLLRKSPGITRNTSPQLVVMFDVVSRDRLLQCDRCNDYRESCNLIEEFNDWDSTSRLYCRDECM